MVLTKIACMTGKTCEERTGLISLHVKWSSLILNYLMKLAPWWTLTGCFNVKQTVQVSAVQNFSGGCGSSIYFSWKYCYIVMIFYSSLRMDALGKFMHNSKNLLDWFASSLSSCYWLYSEWYAGKLRTGGRNSHTVVHHRKMIDRIHSLDRTFVILPLV